ncbi:hypothetical protein PPTG_21111 [Phytophthora nicotianae INRA-310]|uniref:Uncharacterized protein n=1 Tax=Phytophthora nicotianae (strain INRA-310) TaxID=761204 RepID=W2R8U2_PHYN3|nr:hypothetical protein PPTG_21111 [Phytophthora nicotianae INRA-310]ETN21666.1 hypothetical protein PPTG_21111 [Phytophthora nicotianae INRA-310]
MSRVQTAAASDSNALYSRHGHSIQMASFGPRYTKLAACKFCTKYHKVQSLMTTTFGDYKIRFGFLAKPAI